jgi:hypothetical protein
MRCKMILGLGGLGLAGLLLVSCQREQTGNYLQLSGRIFEFNYRLSKATYVITYKVLEAIPKGSSTQTEYQDPRGGPPIVTVAEVFPFWEKVVLTSPPVHCIVKDKTYAVKVTLKGPDGSVLQKLETSITSTLDQTLLPENSIVVGPAYDMNPKVFKPGGVADYHPDTTCKK